MYHICIFLTITDSNFAVMSTVMVGLTNIWGGMSQAQYVVSLMALYYSDYRGQECGCKCDIDACCAFLREKNCFARALEGSESVLCLTFATTFLTRGVKVQTAGMISSNVVAEQRRVYLHMEMTKYVYLVFGQVRPQQSQTCTTLLSRVCIQGGAWSHDALTGL